MNRTQSIERKAPEQSPEETQPKGLEALRNQSGGFEEEISAWLTAWQAAQPLALWLEHQRREGR